VRQGEARQAKNAITSGKTRMGSYFSKAPVLILTPNPNPFRDSLRLSQRTDGGGRGELR